MVKFTKAFGLLCYILAMSPSYALADVKFCNKTIDEVSVAIGHRKSGNWVTNGWYRIQPGKCNTVTKLRPNTQDTYYRATNTLGDSWIGDGSATFCIKPGNQKMNNLLDEGCQGQRQKFGKIGAKARNKTVNITSPTRAAPIVKQSTIQDRCLLRWHDSPQVHSVRTIVRWNYQAVKTRMKKLEHCVRIRVKGPVDIKGIAKSYVKSCMNKALNDDKAKHLLKLLAGVSADVISAGATGGSGTVTALTDYLYAVQDRAISCLTDTTRLERHVTTFLKTQFDVTVKRESHWVYWDL